MTSIQLTHGEMYRAPFAHLGVQAEFLPLNELDCAEAMLNDKHNATLLLPKIKGTFQNFFNFRYIDIFLIKNLFQVMYWILSN